jgi:hypothetical protein
LRLTSAKLDLLGLFGIDRIGDEVIVMKCAHLACPSCEQLVDVDDRFCQDCGARLPVQEAKSAPPPAPVKNLPSSEIFKLHTGPMQMNISADGKISGWPVVEDYGIKQLLSGEHPKPVQQEDAVSEQPVRPAGHRLHSPLLERALESQSTSKQPFGKHSGNVAKKAPVQVVHRSSGKVEWLRPALDASLVLIMVAFSGVAIHWLVNVNLSPTISMKPIKKGAAATSKQSIDAKVSGANSRASSASNSVSPRVGNTGSEVVPAAPAALHVVPAAHPLAATNAVDASQSPKALDISAIAARSESGKRSEETIPPPQISIEMGDKPGQTETRTFARSGASKGKRGILFVAGRDTSPNESEGEKQQLAAKPQPEYTDATEVQLPKLAKPYPDKEVVLYHRLLADYFTKHGKKEADGTTQEDAPEPPSMAEWLQQGKPEF